MRARAGFTLLELMLVVVIGSLLTLMALPHIDVAGARAESGARAAQMAVSAAAHRAVLRQHDVVVEFDEAGSMLRFFDDPNRNRRPDGDEQVWNHPLEETLQFTRGRAPPGPAGAEGISFRDGPRGRPQLVFHRAGSASEAGGFYVATSRAEAASHYMTEVFAVTVQRATGRPRLHNVRANRWVETY